MSNNEPQGTFLAAGDQIRFDGELRRIAAVVNHPAGLYYQFTALGDLARGASHRALIASGIIREVTS